MSYYAGLLAQAFFLDGLHRNICRCVRDMRQCRNFLCQNSAVACHACGPHLEQIIKVACDQMALFYLNNFHHGRVKSGKCGFTRVREFDLHERDMVTVQLDRIIKRAIATNDPAFLQAFSRA